MWIQLGESLYEVDYLSLEIVRDNARTLREQGLYERALLRAFTRTNHATWTLSDLRRLFRKGDPARLRAVGDPVPGSGPFTVYRGVAGRLEWCTFPDPGVYRITIAENAVLAYTNQDEEQEFVVMLPATVKPERVR